MIHFFKKILFSLAPETAHQLAMRFFQLSYQLGISARLFPQTYAPNNVMGLAFPNIVGLAAGFDKNADYVDALAALGFGFIEVGTVTPKPQVGNPRPRLFRLTEQHAIINRMGFNNKGVAHVAQQLENIRYRGILGINIGKNKDTPLENALDDYLICFRQLWKFASYITINISSPNTPGLRDLQQDNLLESLLTGLKQEQQIILAAHKKYVPLVVKISPDITENELIQMAQVFLKVKIDGVIATNTTISREGIEQNINAKESGGLSGQPLFEKSTAVLQQLCALLEDKIPVIASGGVMDVKTAKAKLTAGAKLVQIYSGFIYTGPHLISDLASSLR